GHALAVEPCPKSSESAIVSAALFALVHRLIPVVSLSRKIPVRWCVLKESLKVCTSKSPSFSDDFAADFATFDVFPYCSGAEAQHLSGFAQRQQAVRNRNYRILLSFVCCHFDSQSTTSCSFLGLDPCLPFLVPWFPVYLGNKKTRIGI